MSLLVTIVLIVAAGMLLARWCFYRLARACAEDFVREFGNREQRNGSMMRPCGRSHPDEPAARWLGRRRFGCPKIQEPALK